MGRLTWRAHVTPWLALAVVGCQSPTMGLDSAVTPRLAIDFQAFERAVATSPVIDWSSHTFASETILEAREEASARLAGYKVSYTGFSAPVWTQSHAGLQVSNSPAFAFANVYASGPGPNPGDRVMYMTNGPRGVRSFFIVDARTGTPINGAGWDALGTVGAPGGAKVDGSAITLSAKGTQAMFVTTGAYFGAIKVAAHDATGERLAGVSLGAGRRVANGAPFIDNSANPGIDSRMSVWVSTTDGTDSVGQLHHLTFDSGASPAWSAPRAITVRGQAADGTAGMITAAGFKASPVVWRGKVYLGDVAGRFWEYDIATDTARYWDLSPFSGVATDQIVAPAAFDIGAGLAVTKIFVSCGLRVFWIDPATNEAVPSQNLVVDTATSSAGDKLQGSLDNYPYAGTMAAPIYAADSISVGYDFNVGNPALYNYEITGSTGFNTPNDGRPVSGYVRFNVPDDAFGGRMPIAATLRMTVDPYCIPNASDAGSIFRASNYLKNPGNGQDTGAVWSRTNMQWNRQPRLLVSTPFSSQTGPASQYDRVDWNISGAIPRDGDNYTFVLRGNGKQYNGPACGPITSPGYYGYSAYRNTGWNRYDYRPRIDVRVSNYGADGAIRTQPILLALGSTPRIYVANANALFELNYQDTGTFANAGETHFSLAASGRGGAFLGVVTGLSKFVQNRVTTALGRTGSQYYVYMADENGSGRPQLNKYTVPLDRTAGADSLAQVHQLPAGTSSTTPYLTWDYFGGSLYFADQGVSTSTLYRLPQ